MKSYRPPNQVMISIQGSSIIKFSFAVILFIFLLFSISGALTALKPEYQLKSTSVNTVASNITGGMLYQLLGWENHALMQSAPENSSTPKLTNMMFALSTNVNLDDPRSLLGRELPGFYQFDGKILIAGEGTNYTNMPIESSPPLDILTAEKEATLQNTEDVDDKDNNKSTIPPLSTGKKKVVYIYFSHNTESYLPYLKGVTDPNLAYHSKINVTKIGDRLKEDLEDRGIGTTLDKTDVQAILKQKHKDFTASYEESGKVVQAVLSKNHDLTYLIDIHRDARRKSQTTIKINGKSYAKVAFVIGSNNPNYEKNADFAGELHKILEKKYKGLSRGVLKQGGWRYNGKYNQQLSNKAILIEFGGVDNTFEELYRSADAIADALSEYYWQAEKVNNPDKEKGSKE